MSKIYTHLLSRHTVAICDNDPAGKKLSKYANEHLIASPDLGDMEEQSIRELVKKYL